MSFPSQPPPLAGVVHTDVRVGDDRWHVATAGDPDAPPIVLLHGWPQHWWCWRRVIPALAREYRVYAPDLRGFGWSDTPPGTYSKKGLAADVVRLLDALGLETTTLVGHDWGGFTAWLTALQAPTRIERLVVLSITHPFSLPDPSPKQVLMTLGYQAPLVTPVLGARLQRNVPTFLRTVLRRGVGPDHRWAPEDMRLYVDAWRTPERAAVTQALYRTFVARELPALRRGDYVSGGLGVPTTLIAGSADGLTGPHTFEGVSEHVADLTTHVVEGAGHFLPDEKPTEVANLILGA